MTRFDVIWADRALRTLRTLDRSVQKRILLRLEAVREDPLRFVHRVVRSSAYRLRVGDYRLLLDIEKAALPIFVL